MRASAFPRSPRRRMILAASTAAFAVLVASAAAGRCPAGTERPLMRFPDISGDAIVFVYGEDIWTVPAAGGVARRLTIHDGEERYPQYSPDGSMIAFTGEYDGNADVYVMNVDGGDIRRVTYHPTADEVVGWHPLTNKILFRSSRSGFGRTTRLFLVNPDGTGTEELILHEASHGSFSPDGTKIAYTRVAREHRTWKRYRGGTAQDIFLFDFSTNEDRRIIDFEGTDRMPMWIGGRVYFSSDRDRVLNIHSYDMASGAVEQLTRHSEYDVRRPSADGSKIVYELGGSLWVLDVETKLTREVAVEIRTDAPEVRPYIKTVGDFISDVDCSPSGARALVVARGEVFTVPKKEGQTRNLTRSSGARDKDAVWSPDGSRIAYLSDASGEYEIHVVDQMGSAKPVRLTVHRDGYRHTLRWSPDGTKIAFADQTLSCYYVDVASKKVTKIDKAEYEDVDVSLDRKPINDFAWSPDGRFVAYSKMTADLVYQLYIYSLETGASQCVSDGLFNDTNPVFSRDGEHLFFVSNRRFDPTLCDFEWEMVYKKVAGIYCLALRSDGPRLFPLRSDEEEAAPLKESGAKAAREKSGKKEPTQAERLRIDFEGIISRIEPLPLARGNYRNLSVSESAIFYLNKDEGDFNRFEFRDVGPCTLYRFGFEDREEATVIADVDRYRLSADGTKIVYQKHSTVGIIDATDTDSPGKPLDLAGLTMNLDPRAEWMQIFNEAWRMERDFYYEPKMHGIDWNAMREKYGRLMPYASCRQDVQYIIGELIGELNTSHTYVFGGERRRTADRVNTGMLGVDWNVDPAKNRYRFGRILRVPDWTRRIVPPLFGPGVAVSEGEYLLAVNGEEVTADRNIYSYFQNLARTRVRLLVNAKPAIEGSREIVVEPLSSEYVLRYLDWVERNRAVVARESGGEIGYIHLPDTYLGSASEFPKHFYSQLRKKGLIIDGRSNGGGLDPDIFLRRLDKKPLGYWTRRYSHDQTIPEVLTRAHMVCLTDLHAGSGGDMLPYEFREKKMGPVIGTRTWGGLVGVSMWIPLIDGGGLSAPDYRIYNTEGKWVVENEGVTPDIVVDLDPAEMARGYDAQLAKAIEVLKKKMAEEPRLWPRHEPFKVDR